MLRPPLVDYVLITLALSHRSEWAVSVSLAMQPDIEAAPFLP